MKTTLSLAVAVAVVMFFVGRWTGPKPLESHQKEVDSLNRHIGLLQTRLIQVSDSTTHYKILAETWFKQAQTRPKEKVIIRTIHDNEIQHIDSLSLHGVDSALFARYGSN